MSPASWVAPCSHRTQAPGSLTFGAFFWGHHQCVCCGDREEGSSDPLLKPSVFVLLSLAESREKLGGFQKWILIALLPRENGWG